MRYAMIMAGGSGTRLWPMSRGSEPKQLVPFIEGRSLLQIAAERLEGLVPRERRLICTNEAHRAAIKKSVPGFGDEQILGEPVGRDTVNAVGFTAAVLHAQDPEAVFAVFTADHLIEPAEEFRRCVDIAFRLVEQKANRLVTFAITPTFAATGYGYVEKGEKIEVEGGGGRAFCVKRYVEKPSLEKAEEYLASGRFGWNSGMFVWKAATALEAIRLFKPESHAGLMKIGAAWGTARRRAVLDEVYPTLPKVSVDYAIMEPASTDRRFEVCTVATDVKWLDVGSWPSYGSTLKADASGNRVAGGDAAGVTMLDCAETLVVNAEKGHRVALLGTSGLIVVHTKDATLVMPAEKAEKLKELHAKLPEGLR